MRGTCAGPEPEAGDKEIDHSKQIVHAGKRLALIIGRIVRERDGAVISTCEHNKYNVDADTKI